MPPTLSVGVQSEGVAMDTADMASQREEGEPGLLLKEPAALEEDGLGRTGERGERGVEDSSSSSSCSYWLALYYI